MRNWHCTPVSVCSVSLLASLRPRLNAHVASAAAHRQSVLLNRPCVWLWRVGVDTGVEQDDYFSTLGKAFVGLRLMLDAYPSKKWFVVLGDDNYVLLANYVNVLSAFDPDQPWALSRIVPRQKFGCKVGL